MSQDQLDQIFYIEGVEDVMQALALAMKHSVFLPNPVPYVPCRASKASLGTTKGESPACLAAARPRLTPARVGFAAAGTASSSALSSAQVDKYVEASIQRTVPAREHQGNVLQSVQGKRTEKRKRLW